MTVQEWLEENAKNCRYNSLDEAFKDNKFIKRIQNALNNIQVRTIYNKKKYRFK